MVNEFFSSMYELKKFSEVIALMDNKSFLMYRKAESSRVIVAYRSHDYIEDNSLHVGGYLTGAIAEYLSRVCNMAVILKSGSDKALIDKYSGDTVLLNNVVDYVTRNQYYQIYLLAFDGMHNQILADAIEAKTGYQVTILTLPDISGCSQAELKDNVDNLARQIGGSHAG